MRRRTVGLVDDGVETLARAIDGYAGRFRELRAASNLRDYLQAKPGADEELLTEPMLASLLEDVLGFSKGDYFPQLGKSGLKPDFTPSDLVTHPFVLDAKGSAERLGSWVDQIQRYVDQRALRHGVLFNLREVRVYPRGAKQHDPSLSFALLPLWEAAHGERLPVGPDFEAFARFRQVFAHRRLSSADKIARIRGAESWRQRLGEAEVDVEFLVDQLRRLAADLAADASARADELDEYLASDAGRAQRLLDELRQLALDIEPGANLSSLPEASTGWGSADGLAERVWRQFLLRVSYLALTRILLYRAWEDVGFVEEMLYDGGFDDAYERLNENVRDVLTRAFSIGGERYRTLFRAENNYEWYRPSEAALVEVLYRLGAIPLGKLDRDALGALYVTYVDEIDRDRLGQFFTPRDVVGFMLDRAGFSGDGLFRTEGDERRPLRIFDFATGSGGFLVEAARRVIDEAGIAHDDRKGLGEALRAVASGFFGGEISPFPYYLTEINLLLQVSRLLGRMRIIGMEPPGFTLGVVRTDSLATKSSPASSLDVAPEHRGDTAELVAHNIYDLFPVEPEKQGKYRELRQDEAFDLVIGNPPYVAEANNRPLFEHLRSIPAWRGVYRGKTDYLYYFLLLAVEKLRPGGRLCVITPAAWMNAGTADFLRERLAAELTLDELYLFGSYKLFAVDQGPAPTPTVESAILVATKGPAPKGHKLRVVALEEERIATPSGRRELIAEMTARARGRAGRKAGIHVHSVRQSDLRPEYPWPVKVGAKDVAARVVSHLQQALDTTEPVEPLVASWKVFQGVQTGADAYTRRIERRLTPADRAKLAGAGVGIGSPILELPKRDGGSSPWREHPELLLKSPESRALLYAAIDDEDFAYLVSVPRQDPPQDIVRVLEPFKPLLETRAEIARNARRKWWEAAWPRNTDDMRAPKVIALYRTDRGRFALDETGEWQPSIKATIVIGREPNAPVAYLCGLLNSELLDLWYAVRGKTPWHVRRNYEPKRMNEIPYRRPEGDRRADEVARLVRVMAANRRALLPHRAVVRQLARTVKDPWKTGPVEIDRAALVAELPAAATTSVRLAFEVQGKPGGRAKRLAADTLVFRRGRDESGRVIGDAALLDLVEEVLAGRTADAPTAFRLPKSLASLDALAEARAKEITELLAEGRRLVEEVERLVCALYDVPDDLTDAVVAHAVARAGTSTPSE